MVPSSTRIRSIPRVNNEATPPEPIEPIESQELVITEALIAEAMESFGAPIHKACPRCGSDSWNSSAKSSDRIVLKYDPSDQRTLFQKSAAFYIDCGNCGFLEHYIWRPVIDFVMRKDG